MSGHDDEAVAARRRPISSEARLATVGEHDSYQDGSELQDAASSGFRQSGPAGAYPAVLPCYAKQFKCAACNPRVFYLWSLLRGVQGAVGRTTTNGMRMHPTMRSLQGARGSQTQQW